MVLRHECQSSKMWKNMQTMIPQNSIMVQHHGAVWSCLSLFACLSWMPHQAGLPHSEFNKALNISVSQWVGRSPKNVIPLVHCTALGKFNIKVCQRIAPLPHHQALASKEGLMAWQWASPVPISQLIYIYIYYKLYNYILYNYILYNLW